MSSLIKYIIFLLPVVAILIRLWVRLFEAEKSAKSDFDEIKNKGFKRHFLGKMKFTIFPIACFVAAPLYIEYGWLWLAFGAILLLSILFMLIAPDTQKTVPEFGSSEFEQAVSKRKQGSIIGIIIMMLWIVSWNQVFT